MKVLVTVPCLGEVAHEFAFSLAALCGRLGRETSIDFGLQHYYGSTIVDARNSLAKLALQSGASHMMCLDSDMTFPPDVVERLLAHGEPIVCADYYRREPPLHFVGRPDIERGSSQFLSPMKSIGFGMVLVQTSVFLKLKEPWFNYETRPNETISEDVWFCNRARKAGFTIWRDNALTLEIGHVARRVIRPGTKEI